MLHWRGYARPSGYELVNMRQSLRQSPLPAEAMSSPACSRSDHWLRIMPAGARSECLTVHTCEDVPGLSAPPLPVGGSGTPSTGGSSREPRLPSSAGRSKPAPPSHPRPSSLPDYRTSFAADGAKMGGAGGGGGGGAAIGQFRSFPARPPPAAGNIFAKTLQQAAPGSVVARLSKLLAGGFQSKKQRELDAARERARRSSQRGAGSRRAQPADNLDNLDGLLQRELHDDESDDDGRVDDDADEDGGLTTRKHQTPGRASVGGTDAFGLERLRRMLSSPEVRRPRESIMSDPPTGQRHAF